MGSDSYSNLHRWKNHQLLVKNYSIIVYNRPGFEVKDNLYNATILKAPILDISSTTIREQLKDGKSIQYLVSDTVFKELTENGYYK
jgi:nicotinate-nucleotide adenylyltransferase